MRGLPINFRYALLGLILIGFAMQYSGAAWVQYANYRNSVNITVNSWAYNPDYIQGTPSWSIANLSNTFVNYALINLTKISDPTSMSIYGYDPGLNNLGKVSYWLVAVNGSNTIIEVPNTTVNGARWSSISIFYNHTVQNATNNTYNSTTLNINTGHNSNFVLVGSKLFTSSCPQNATVCATSPLSNTPYAYFNTSIVNPLTNIVVLASNTLISGGFNITWYPTSALRLVINETGGRYDLVAPASIHFSFEGRYPYISNASVTSYTPNAIFNNINGFSGYFSNFVTQGSSGSQHYIVYSEGMGLVNYRLYNYSLTNNTYSWFNLNQSKLIIKANTPTPTTFYVMPAFTSNYVVSPVAVNNNIITSTSTNCLNFEYELPVNGITFNSVFLTQTLTNVALVEQFNSNVVWYSKITIPHYQHIGLSCQTLGVYASDGAGANTLIPFAIANCSSNPTAPISIIMANHTIGGYPYNSINLEWGNPTNASSGLANSILFGLWEFRTPQFDISTTLRAYPNLPFINTFLNSIPSTARYTLLSNGSTIYNAVITGGSTLTQYFSGGAIAPLSPISDTKYLFYDSNSLATGIAYVNSANMNLSYDYSSPANIEACVTSACNSVYYTGLGRNPNQIYGQLNGQGPQGYATYLYSSTYTLGKVTSLYQSCYTSSIGFPIENTTVNVNKTITAQNLTNSISTPNYQSPSLFIPIVIFQGFSLPLVYVTMFGIILVLLSTAFLPQERDEIGIVFMILMIWLIGLLDIQIEIVAFIFTIIFISYELTHPKRGNNGEKP